MDNKRRTSFKQQWETGLKRMQSLSRKSRSMPDDSSLKRSSNHKSSKELVNGNWLPSTQNQEERERSRDATISALPDGYFQEEFEAPLFELQRMAPNFQVSELDVVVEERATVLEAVSERLSKHVLANYDVFVQGVNEAASVEADLQAAVQSVKVLRGRLASAQVEVEANIAIAAQQKQKQALMSMADILLKLQQVSALLSELKEAQEETAFAESFWLYSQCCKLLEPLQSLSATDELLDAVNQLYAETIQRLESALCSTCYDFEESQYFKVLEGYVFLGDTTSLGEEVVACFLTVINSGALKVVRGVVLTRAGMEEKARYTTIFQELVGVLPQDLFRQCLAKVLMVIFDILASNYRMLRWHQERLEDHEAELARLRSLHDRLKVTEDSDAEPDTYAQELSLDDASQVEDRAQEAQDMASDAMSKPFLADARSISDEQTGQAIANSERNGVDGTSSSEVGATASRNDQISGVFGNSRLLASGNEAELDPLSSSQDVAVTSQRLESEEAWGEALAHVAEGLGSGQRALWDAAARKVAVLLAAPAAFQGEHFLQVLEWTQTILQVGESFSGSESSSLRDAMRRHSGHFFHAANLQALQMMLEQEMWKRLPMTPGKHPDFLSALQGTLSHSTSQKFDSSSFPAWVEHGNPWKKRAPDSMNGTGDLSRTESGNTSIGETLDLCEEMTSKEEGHQGRHKPGSDPPTSGRSEDSLQPAMTNASWRMLQWMSDYAGLMRMLRADSGKIYSSCCELFELYFLHVFHTFSDVSIADVAGEQCAQRGGADAVPVRLKNAVLRILHRSLPRLREQYFPQRQQNGPSQGPSSGGQQGGISPAAAQQTSTNSMPAITALSNPGNMYGLQERKTAVDSLLAIGGQLQKAQATLAERLSGRSDVPEHHSLDTFLQTVKAAVDLRDLVLRAAARLNLPIWWIPERLSEQNFNLEEPPTKSSPWVEVLLNHFRVFWQRLETATCLSPDDRNLLWRFGLQFAADMVLEGLARAGGKGRCTVMGRSAMSLDMQGLQRGLQGITGGQNTADIVAGTLRIVDSYIKAYYMPWGEQLHRWALTHPEYTQDQIMLLVGCIAESNNLKRKDRIALIGQIESDLRGFQ